MKIQEAASRLRFEEVECCPVCESSQRSPKFVSPDYLHGVPGEFQYVTCGACSTVYQNPRVVLADLGLCYPSDYFTHVAPDASTSLDPPDVNNWTYDLRRAVRHFADGTSAAGVSWVPRLFGRLLAHFPPARKWARYGVRDPLAASGEGNRCLEVGPGAGKTLRSLRWIGWQAVGLDLDPHAASTAERASGCTVKVGTLTSTDLPDESFDLIFMSHVLEHLPDLRPALQRCIRLLAPGGRLVVVYPNPESLGVQWQEKFAVNWDPPRHLVVPPLKAIVALLNATGFDRFETRTSAGSAAGYRKIARQYRAGRTGKGFENTKPSLGDRIFGVYESVLVMLGSRVGEEIRVTAWKAK
ncbi:MAG: putative SAM-dependent methyltransferase [Acidobacteriaceae bacterium]|jgi:SAM-dependent methyltransferase|nr:putative SAM-dependent methyltransferase [Acidobacteriaceae bacterium]